jgi:hypothetical protein
MTKVSPYWDRVAELQGQILGHPEAREREKRSRFLGSTCVRRVAFGCWIGEDGGLVTLSQEQTGSWAGNSVRHSMVTHEERDTDMLHSYQYVLPGSNALMDWAARTRGYPPHVLELLVYPTDEQLGGSQYTNEASEAQRKLGVTYATHAEEADLMSMLERGASGTYTVLPPDNLLKGS